MVTKIIKTIVFYLLTLKVKFLLFLPDVERRAVENWAPPVDLVAVDTAGGTTLGVHRRLVAAGGRQGPLARMEAHHNPAEAEIKNHVEISYKRKC